MVEYIKEIINGLSVENLFFCCVGAMAVVFIIATFFCCNCTVRKFKKTAKKFIKNPKEEDIRDSLNAMPVNGIKKCAGKCKAKEIVTAPLTSSSYTRGSAVIFIISIVSAFAFYIISDGAKMYSLLALASALLFSLLSEIISCGKRKSVTKLFAKYSNAISNAVAQEQEVQEIPSEGVQEEFDFSKVSAPVQEVVEQNDAVIEQEEAIPVQEETIQEEVFQSEAEVIQEEVAPSEAEIIQEEVAPTEAEVIPVPEVIEQPTAKEEVSLSTSAIEFFEKVEQIIGTSVSVQEIRTLAMELSEERLKQENQSPLLRKKFSEAQVKLLGAMKSARR